jgi:hypothetical protein
VNAQAAISWRNRLDKILYFFPFQLLFLQLKRNYLLLSFWLLLFAFVLDGIGSKYGISHLFLYPEYRGCNDSIAYCLLGFSIGGFIVSYNLYTYIIHSHRFPFLATLDKPLYKFSINNFIIPLTFILVYSWSSYQFQVDKELVPQKEAFFNLLSFTLGVFLMAGFSFVYFRLTNKNIRFFTDKLGEEGKEESLASSALQKSSSWEDLEKRTEDWRVDTYMFSFRRVLLARSIKHYPREVLEKVLAQHHVNASFFELMIIISFILVGLFREHRVFEIPAASSAVLFFTVLVMLFSAIYSWIKGWTFPLIISMILIINFSPVLTSSFNLETRVYGLDYSGEKEDYNSEVLKNSITPDDYDRSLKIQIKSLDNWKSKVSKGMNKKPKLVILSVSGGGLRSALWTMKSVLTADSAMNGELLNNTHLITGSSGGMIGASYMRELVRENGLDYSELSAEPCFDDISRDILNPMILAMATHDLALRYRKAEVDGDYHLMDRAYSFERKLNINTSNRLNKKLSDFVEPEFESRIPTMIFSPTINLDGRRLIVGAQDFSFLCLTEEGELQENVCYTKLFKDRDPLNTEFTSVLRMNATFPYVLPASTLPTSQLVKVADAGLRDNFGLRVSFNYINELKEWIELNTSGVVLVEVRDTRKNAEKKPSPKMLLNELTSPLGGVYSNVIRTQDYDNELQLDLLRKSLSVPIHRIPFELELANEKRATLSWHLTKFEKESVLSGVKTESFLSSLNELKVLINDN